MTEDYPRRNATFASDLPPFGQFLLMRALVIAAAGKGPEAQKAAVLFGRRADRNRLRGAVKALRPIIGCDVRNTPPCHLGGESP